MYLAEILIKTLFYSKAAIWTAWERWIIDPSAISRVDIYIIKVSKFASSAILINSLLSIG